MHVSPLGNSDNIYLVIHSTLHLHDFNNKHNFSISLSHSVTCCCSLYYFHKAIPPGRTFRYEYHVSSNHPPGYVLRGWMNTWWLVFIFKNPIQNWHWIQIVFGLEWLFHSIFAAAPQNILHSSTFWGEFLSAGGCYFHCREQRAFDRTTLIHSICLSLTTTPDVVYHHMGVIIPMKMWIPILPIPLPNNFLMWTLLPSVLLLWRYWAAWYLA